MAGGWAVPAPDGLISWSSEQLSSWLEEQLGLPVLATAAAREAVDGKMALEMVMRDEPARSSALPAAARPEISVLLRLPGACWAEWPVGLCCGRYARTG
jgi:hypothetical protein